MTDPAAVPAVPTTPAAPAAAAPATPAPAVGAPAPPTRRRNVVGLAAFIFGLAAFLSPAIGVAGGFALIGELPNSDGLNLFNILFFGAIGAGVGCAVGVIPFVLGFVSLAVKNAKRLWGILGLVLAVIAILVGWIPLVAFLTSIANPATPGVPING